MLLKLMDWLYRHREAEWENRRRTWIEKYMAHYNEGRAVGEDERRKLMAERDQLAARMVSLSNSAAMSQIAQDECRDATKRSIAAEMALRQQSTVITKMEDDLSRSRGETRALALDCSKHIETIGYLRRKLDGASSPAKPKMGHKNTGRGLPLHYTPAEMGV